MRNQIVKTATGWKKAKADARAKDMVTSFPAMRDIHSSTGRSTGDLTIPASTVYPAAAARARGSQGSNRSDDFPGTSKTQARKDSLVEDETDDTGVESNASGGVRMMYQPPAA